MMRGHSRFPTAIHSLAPEPYGRVQKRLQRQSLDGALLDLAAEDKASLDDDYLPRWQAPGGVRQFVLSLRHCN
jgi:hypothetical protein